MSAERPRAYMNWSGGKDSTLALDAVLRAREFEVTTLVTTVNAEHRRISMHGVREALLEAQAAAIGIPLRKIELPDAPSMTAYETAMDAGIRPLLEAGHTHAIFGDIFLEDLRAYRDAKLAAHGLIGAYPLWRRDTRAVVEEFVDRGFKAVVVCADAAKLDASFAGRTIDRAFLADLPPDVDPCGESGEFHSFVYDGPIFARPVTFELGERVLRTYPRPAGGTRDICATDAPPAATAQATMGFHYIDLV